MERARIIQVLRGARELIATPQAWRQGAYAGRRFGEEASSPNGDWHATALVDVFGNEANCWCLSGAVLHCGMTDAQASHFAKLELMHTVGCPLPQFNDDPERTHEQVLAAVDATLQRLEAA